MHLSERWFRLLQRLYPPDFRDEMGNAVVEAYMDRARDALNNGGSLRLVTLWLRALVDSLRNGSAERIAPGGLVAARRQLGPRCRTRDTTAGALADVRRDDDRHADGRAWHVRRRVHGRRRRF